MDLLYIIIWNTPEGKEYGWRRVHSETREPVAESTQSWPSREDAIAAGKAETGLEPQS